MAVGEGLLPPILGISDFLFFCFAWRVTGAWVGVCLWSKVA
jgi:hypothetical protein